MIVNAIPSLDDARYDAWEERNRRALFLINKSIQDNQYEHILGATTAKEAWNILQQRNQPSSPVKNQRKLFK